MGLDFGGALENAEDAGVAENPRNREFKRETVAAVNLHGVVGGRPGYTRREKLGHAGFEIAAPSGILLPRGVVSELAGDHDFRRHHGELVGNARSEEQTS